MSAVHDAQHQNEVYPKFYPIVGNNVQPRRIETYQKKRPDAILHSVVVLCTTGIIAGDAQL